MNSPVFLTYCACGTLYKLKSLDEVLTCEGCGEPVTVRVDGARTPSMLEAGRRLQEEWNRR